jgi:hypothetical protein
MRTSTDRFHKALLCYGKPGDVHEFMTYTYESARALYDVIDTGSELVYRTNMKTSEPTIHHALICKHFGLGTLADQTGQAMRELADDVLGGK